MDPVSKSIVDKFVSQIIDSMFVIVKRHFGYLTYYKEKIQKLEAEIEELKGQRDRIQGMVNRARDNAEVIEDDVSKWLIDVQRMEDEVKEFLADKVKENKLCFKCTCPDLGWRHQLGKGAQEKKAAVASLKEEGGKFDTLPVAHSAPYPQELQFTSSMDYMIFDSRASVFNGVLEALKDSRVNVIGIHGPGGVGKTTMVEEVAKQAKSGGLFREFVIVAVSKDADVRKIQEQLGLQLNLTYKEDSVKARAGQLWNRLEAGNKHILVILDDVWEKLDWKAIGIPTADGDKACKVILTSRNEDVCRNMEAQPDFSIGFLPESEAWALFSKVVGNFHVPQAVAEKVCKECGGLPVVIVVVGAALKRKAAHAWSDAFNQLENSTAQVLHHIDPKIYTSLQWSYDMLQPEDAKSCFLLCCLFPEDAEISIDVLVWYCMALRLHPNVDTLEKARNRVYMLVDVLKSSYLLLDGGDEDLVKMHDVIRDVAISIVKGEQKSQVNQGVHQLWSDQQWFLVEHCRVQEWPKEVAWESFSAMSLRSRDIKKLPDEPECPELHTLVLECRNDQLEVPDRFFHGMKKVKVLDLIGIKNFPITLSLANLEELRMLRITGYYLRSTAIIKNLKDTLEILIVQDYDIKELPAEIGKLTRLRLLDLQKCFKLREIPEGGISSLLCLEELYFPNDFWVISPTANRERRFAELKGLTQLTTLHVRIPIMMPLPKEFPFENLTRFVISVGYLSHDERFTRKLTLSDIGLKDEFNGLLDKVELLQMFRVKVLKNGLNQSAVSFSKLTVLHVSECRLKYLFSPSCAGGIQQLQTLEIEDCHMTEAIVGIEGEIDEKEPADQVICFSRLKCIRLKRLLKLISFHHKIESTTMEGNPSSTPAQSLFNEQVVFPALEELEIDSTPNTEIWGEQLLPVQKTEAESFCQLRVMKVSRCEKLVNVVPSYMLYRSQNLEILSVEECTSVISLVEWFSPKDRHTAATTFITARPRLRELELINLSNLEILSIQEANEDIIVFPQLRTLKLEALQNLKSFCAHNFEAQPLFNHKVAFPKLKNLSLSGLESSREIQLWHVLAGHERSLDSVKVMGCHQVSTIVSPHLMQRLKTKLGKLVLQNCGGMRQVFYMEGLNHDGELGQFVGTCVEVKILVLCSLPELRCLWNKDPHGILALHHLQFLAISHCPLLRNLLTASVAMALKQLDALIVTSCEEIEEVVTNEGEGEGEEDVIGEIIFPNLKVLGLLNLPNLKSFCSAANYAFKFPSLQEVVLERCPKMHTFTSRQVSMRQIYLYTADLHKSRQIGDLNEYLEQPKEFERMEVTDRYRLYFFQSHFFSGRHHFTYQEMAEFFGL